MNTKLFGITLVCTFYSGSLMAQKIDSALLIRQQSELKQVLLNVDQKMTARQRAWSDAQTKKVKYDTIGLAQYRYEWSQLKQQRKLLEIAFVKEHPGYVVSLTALKDAIGAIPDDIQLYDTMFQKLDKSVKITEEGVATKKMIDRYLTVRIGAQAPLFTAADTSGNEVKLSDYKGKYVLLDFWASWCSPCREENPTVVKAWKDYKGKNFDILSVSLDQPGKRDAWIKAIHDDQLTWQHVSDLKYWNNAVAQLYAVRSIPQNFLIDPKGKIIAVNLRGADLNKKLMELLPAPASAK